MTLGSDSCSFTSMTILWIPCLQDIFLFPQLCQYLLNCNLIPTKCEGDSLKYLFLTSMIPLVFQVWQSCLFFIANAYKVIYKKFTYSCIYTNANAHKVLSWQPQIYICKPYFFFHTSDHLSILCLAIIFVFNKCPSKTG